jgi:D-alanyl-D-alanine carboxypeptidase/Putative peptidoglycan binding domain
MALPVLKRGDRGDAVFLWQNFLVGKKLLKQSDGIFGKDTEDQTKAFQISHNLKDDGIVGAGTYAAALVEGLDAIEFDVDFPYKPSFSALVSTSDRQKVFGKFDFEINSLPSNREHIKIIGNWVQANIAMVDVPEAKSVISSSKIEFHRSAAAQLQGLWKVWQLQDLTKYIITFDGSFVPRLIRGAALVKDPSRLSNHAFGSAFDINADFNSLGTIPAAVGQKGSVRLLVPIANDYGFYWGGHFNTRKDGMHFEIAKVLSDTDLATLATKYKI